MLETNRSEMSRVMLFGLNYGRSVLIDIIQRKYLNRHSLDQLRINPARSLHIKNLVFSSEKKCANRGVYLRRPKHHPQYCRPFQNNPGFFPISNSAMVAPLRLITSSTCNDRCVAQTVNFERSAAVAMLAQIHNASTIVCL